MLSDEKIRELVTARLKTTAPRLWADNPEATMTQMVDMHAARMSEALRILTSANLVVVDLAELEAALKPFKEAADGWSAFQDGEKLEWITRLTVADLRRAAALLAALTQEKT